MNENISSKNLFNFQKKDELIFPKLGSMVIKTGIKKNT